MSEFMSQQGWFMNIVRDICFALDMLIYRLMRFIFQGIFDLADLRASAKFIEDITGRLYVVLGIYMVFKLSITFFSYIVDPDSMSDTKGKGVGKVIANTMVMLTLLVTLPMLLFGFGTDGASKGLMYQAQDALLPMLPRIILGEQSNTGWDDDATREERITYNSDVMASSAFSVFFYRAPAAWPTDPNDPKYVDEKCTSDDTGYPLKFTSLDDIQPYLNQSCPIAKGGRYYIYNYSFILSGIVGLIMVVILIGILLDVGKRVFKLLILQAIAPIPIMSYIDPKSAKEGAFAAWVKSLTNTFLEVFFKIGTVYIVLELIKRIADANGISGIVDGAPTNGDFRRDTFLLLVLIIALLLFAKEAPKFIRESMGMKDKPGGGGMMGKFAGKMGGLAGGAAMGAARGLITGHGNPKSMLTGMAAGAEAGYNAAGTGKPSNAGKAAADAALQARTGNDKAQAGILNAAKRVTSDWQKHGQARKRGLSPDELKADAKRVTNLEADADKAEADAKMAMEDSSLTAAEKAQFQDRAITARTEAKDAAGAYSKRENAAKAYGVDKYGNIPYKVKNRKEMDTIRDSMGKPHGTTDDKGKYSSQSYSDAYSGITGRQPGQGGGQQTGPQLTPPKPTLVRAHEVGGNVLKEAGQNLMWQNTGTTLDGKFAKETDAQALRDIDRMEHISDAEKQARSQNYINNAANRKKP